MKVKRFTTLDEAAEAKALYAVNLSDLNGKQAKGQLVFRIPTESGDDVPVTLPPTWIFFNLTEFASISDVQRSSQLRQLMRAGLLALITKDSADAMALEPNFEAEVNRVNELRRRMSSSNTEAQSTELNIDTNSGQSSIVDPVPQTEQAKVHVPGDSEKPAYVMPQSAVRMLEANTSSDWNTLNALARQTFPTLAKQDFIEILGKIGNPQSPLFKYCSDAIGFLEEGTTVTLDGLPSYLELQSGADSGNGQRIEFESN